jgi:hypothetical protein
VRFPGDIAHRHVCLSEPVVAHMVTTVPQVASVRADGPCEAVALTALLGSPAGTNYAELSAAIRLTSVPSRSTLTVTVSPAVSGRWASRPWRPHSSARHPPPQVPDPNPSPGMTQVPRDA